jgi:glucose/mannose-6-phosphate isomerase
MHVRGSSELATLLIACHLGDWVSLYLAMLNDVDPAPVPAIGALKRALRSGPA